MAYKSLRVMSDLLHEVVAEFKDTLELEYQTILPQLSNQNGLNTARTIFKVVSSLVPLT